MIVVWHFKGVKVIAHGVRNFCMLKKLIWPLIVSITFAHCLRSFCPSKIKFGSGSIFCVFAPVACILIEKDEEYERMEKRMREFLTLCAMTLSVCFVNTVFPPPIFFFLQLYFYKSLLCSPWLHLFVNKYYKNCKIVKYLQLLFYIWVYARMQFTPVMQSWIFSSFTWSYRNPPLSLTHVWLLTAHISIFCMWYHGNIFFVVYIYI